MKKLLFLFLALCLISRADAQINTDRVLSIGRNALYFEDYVLSIQYFNQVIRSKPYLAEPYYYRAVAKYNLGDFKGTEEDATLCLDRNQFLVYAYELRGAARQNQENYALAIEDYNKGLEFNPENRQLLVNKAIAQMQLKDYDDAEQDINLMLKYHPQYVPGYLLRSAMHLEKQDTVASLNDIEKTLSMDKYYSPAYNQRSVVYFYQGKYREALADLNEAIRLDPKNTAYYIRRGLVLYYMEDLRGAMKDYDIVVSMDEHNRVARFNRGLLRAQVGDDNNAIEDFSEVIGQEPDNYMALYNRGLLREQIGDYKGALEDINRVQEEYPNFMTIYYVRSDIKKKLRDFRGAEKDYWYAYELQQKMDKGKLQNVKSSDDKTREESDKSIEKFNRLVVYDKDKEEKSNYSNSIRGKVQDRNVSIEPEASFIMTYYEKTGDVERSKYYDKSVDDLNKQLNLKMKLILTNAEAPLTDEQVDMHFRSINNYSKEIEDNPVNVWAYFGRAMDYMVLQDLTSAMEDYSKVISLDSEFSLAYFNRAMIRYKQMEIGSHASAGSTLSVDIKNSDPALSSSSITMDTRAKEKKQQYEYELIMRDYDMVIKLNPKFPYAYFNRGNMKASLKDFKAAIADYNEAIRVEPELAEAYFNRGLARLSLGDNERGLADLSKAGELGIVSAYAIIKRMSAE